MIMQTEKSIEQIMNEVSSERKVDYACPKSKMSVFPRGDKMVLDCHVQAFPMTNYATEQMDASLAPGFQRFGRHLRSEGFNSHYAEVASELLKRDVKKAQIRTVDRGVGAFARAVVSDAYKTIDDDVIFGTALPVIGKHSGRFKSLGGNRTDTRSYLKFVTREPVFSITTDVGHRDFSAGFIMKNSEVGMGFCEFMTFLTDSYCDNGCIFSKQIIADVKYAHRGARISTELGPIMNSRIKDAELCSIQAVIEEASQIACSSDFSQVKHLIETSTQREITADNVIDVINGVGKQVGMTKNECLATLEHYDSSSRNQFGIQAAITALAQTQTDYDRRIELETIGGKVIEMSDKQWKMVNAA